MTVFWIRQNNITFRGTDNQGDLFHPKSEVFDPAIKPGFTRKCGIRKGGSGGEGSKPIWWINTQVEAQWQITPDLNFGSDLEWYIRREISAKEWERKDGVLTLPQWTKGATDWDPDGCQGYENDLNNVQNDDCTLLFSVDTPGPILYSAGFMTCTKTMKGKFREWAEVKIGSDWYVCSPYLYWRHLVHVEFKNPTDGWDTINSETNEAIDDTFSGFAGSWMQEP